LSSGFTQSGFLSFVDEKVDYGYVYNVTAQNLNYRTIQGFSTEAKAKMANCETCPYPDYKKFTDYYGKNDYGDHIITSAFNGLSTRMSNGNMQFELYEEEARTGPGNVNPYSFGVELLKALSTNTISAFLFSEVIQKAMAYMNIWMYVIRQMEVAIDECHDGCAADLCKFRLTFVYCYCWFGVQLTNFTNSLAIIQVTTILGCILGIKRWPSIPDRAMRFLTIVEI
jgi:hypothetical protein